MASNVPEKMKIPTAIDKVSKQVFNSQHVSSTNFMEFGVAFSKELVPKQKFNIRTNTFARLKPLVSPTMGRARVNNRTFFVPFRTVWPAWHDYKERVKHTFSDGTSAFVTTEPRFSDSAFRAVFTGPEYSSLVSSGTAFDFEYVKSDGSSQQRKLTPKGRRAMKLLHSLGYAVDFDERHGEFYSSALPLLCAAKVYIDWYLNPQYSEDVRYTNLIKLFKYDKSDYINIYSITVLTQIFEVLGFVNYSPDYFVSAWDKPYSPNPSDLSSQDSIKIIDITNGSDSEFASSVQSENGSNDSNYGFSNAPKLIGGTVGRPLSIGAISQFGLNALKKLTDFLKRNQLAGSRLIDRYLARYGIVLDSDKLQRSYRLRDEQSPIAFGDVTSTADTEGANLGSYAGKGVYWNDNDVPVSFECEEPGRIIVISTVIPNGGYYQGQHRDTMSLTSLDHWTPEFDQLDVQAISKRELYVPLKDEIDLGPDGWDGEVFGFTPRYSNYKVCHDILSGDFRFDSLNVGLDSWHLLRDVSSRILNRTIPRHSILFTEGNDAQQYNRIFQITDDVADQIIVHHQFDIVSYFPGASLWDTYDFDEKGDKVDVNTGGTQVN